MCEWGYNVRIEGHLNKWGKPFYVDECIASLIQVLNDNGFLTIASCCGHGKSFGNISLRNGKELIIMPDFETARLFEKKIKEIQNGK